MAHTISIDRGNPVEVTQVALQTAVAWGVRSELIPYAAGEAILKKAREFYTHLLAGNEIHMTTAGEVEYVAVANITVLGGNGDQGMGNDVEDEEMDVDLGDELPSTKPTEEENKI